MEIGSTKFTRILAEKAKWAHIDWVKQKEDAEKKKAEKLKRKNALLEKKKLQNHEGTGFEIYERCLNSTF